VGTASVLGTSRSHSSRWPDQAAWPVSSELAARHPTVTISQRLRRRLAPMTLRLGLLAGSVISRLRSAGHRSSGCPPCGWIRCRHLFRPRNCSSRLAGFRFRPRLPLRMNQHFRYAGVGRGPIRDQATGPQAAAPAARWLISAARRLGAWPQFFDPRAWSALGPGPSAAARRTAVPIGLDGALNRAESKHGRIVQTDFGS